MDRHLFRARSCLNSPFDAPRFAYLRRIFLVIAVLFTGAAASAVVEPFNFVWYQPMAIDYPTPLGPNELNALPPGDGVMTYDPAAGTVLAPGSHVLRATFTPSDPASPPVSEQVTIVVNPQTSLTVLEQPEVMQPAEHETARTTFKVQGSVTAYQWQTSSDWGRTWIELADTGRYSGTHSDTLAIADGPDQINASWYRCVVTCPEGTVVSKWTMYMQWYPNTPERVAYYGGYFGTFSDGGSWALFVGTPCHFIGYLPSRGTAFVQTIEVASDGPFAGSCSEFTALDAVKTTLALNGSITAPSQGVRPVTGSLAEIGVTLTGAFPRGGALTNLSGDYFSATALGTQRGKLYLVVGYDGSFQAVVLTADFADGASGVLNPDGTFTGRTAGGRALQFALNTKQRTLSATLGITVSAASLRGVNRRAAITVGTGSPANSGPGTPPTPPPPDVAPPIGGSIDFAGAAEAIAASRFLDIATRAYCSSGNAVTIGGFVVTGSGSKRVLIRAVGPTLATLGLPTSDVLQDPILEVHDASHGNTVIAHNDNWGDTAHDQIQTVAKQVGATALASTDTTSAALLIDLTPGAYTFVVKGNHDSSGIVLLEVYDVDGKGSPSRFVNIATRAYAGTDNRVAIGGFVVGGNVPKQLLVRAVGPTLAKLGLDASSVLADPVIQILDAKGQSLLTNQNWTDGGADALVRTTAARVGATPLDSADKTSSGVLVTLQPGAYTFIASGANNTSGVVLVEVYDAD